MFENVKRMRVNLSFAMAIRDAISVPNGKNPVDPRRPAVHP
jgi:hypothetical protein